MGQLAIVGGSGFAAAIPAFEVHRSQAATTAYGRPSAELAHGTLAGSPVVFLPRHGSAHGIPPHLINYRANIQSLADAGVDRIIALAAVGGITPDAEPLSLWVPDQLIDYTHGRSATFFDGDDGGVVHVDFSFPFDDTLRRGLLGAAERAGARARDGGTSGVTQGPRLETAAEIRRLERDGCDIVGMTVMPEAALARERGSAYAVLAFVVNWAAGKTEGEIGMDEIEANLARCRADIARVLVAFAGSMAQS